MKNYAQFINEKELSHYYTFDDLVWKEHFMDGKRSRFKFDNKYEMSVLFGDKYFYSNGIDTYEVAFFTPDGTLDDPKGYLTKDQITDEMIRIQKIKKTERKFTPEDPFGEEDWDVNEASSDVKYNFKVGDYVVCKGHMDAIDFKGEVGVITRVLANNLYTVKFLTKFDTSLYNAYDDPSRCSYNVYIKYLKPCDKKSLKKIKEKEEELNKKKEELRLKHIDIDPYGEEDWDINENVENDTIIDYLKNKIIMYSTKEEMISIARILNGNGFKTYTPLYKMEKERLDYKYYFCDLNGVFVRSMEEFKLRNWEELTLLDLSNLLDKKFKKIENPIDDPYGEEDWGWEELKEN